MKTLAEIKEQSEESNVYDGCIIGEIYTSKQVDFIAKEYAKQALEEAAGKTNFKAPFPIRDILKNVRQQILLLINELK